MNMAGRWMAHGSGIGSFFIVLIPLLLLVTGAWSQPNVDPYDKAMARIRCLSDSPDVRLIKFGKSTAGRSIPAFVISDFNADSKSKLRVFICSGQHGDEYNPVNSVLSLCEDMVSGRYPEILSKCEITVIPMVNPDGIAAGQRLNANGVDINRDWNDRLTLEARYTHSLIMLWKPQALMDIHEWTGSSPIPGNEIELARCVRPGQAKAMSRLVKEVAMRSGLTEVRCSEHCDPRLFHRKYSLQGYGAYLIETAAGENKEIKNRLYTAAIVNVIDSVLQNEKMRLALSPEAKGFNPSDVSSYLVSKQADDFDPTSSPIIISAMLVFGYLLLMCLLKSTLPKDETIWSRRFRNCRVDPELAAYSHARKHMPEPLTSKSWVRRRIRVKYEARVEMFEG